MSIPDNPSSLDDRARILSLVANVADYPKRGIVYTDVSPVFADPEIVGRFVGSVERAYVGSVDAVLGVDSMGFVLASPIAARLGLPLVISRKGEKILPRSVSARVSNSYRSTRIGIRCDDVRAGRRVLIVDDVMGTGTTFLALASLVESLGGVVAGSAHLLDLAFVARSSKLRSYRHYAHVVIEKAEFETMPRTPNSAQGWTSRALGVADRLKSLRRGF